MPVREMRECWNCGRNYDPDEHESCPSCGEYPSNDPDLKEDQPSFDKKEYFETDDDEDDELVDSDY